MYAFSLSLLLPLLAAAAPAPIAELDHSSDSSLVEARTPPPSGAPPVIPRGAHFCTDSKGPQPEKDSAFFVQAENVLSNMQREWNTFSAGKWSFPNSKGQTVSGLAMFSVENTASWPDAGSCIDSLRPGVKNAIDIGATGGSFETSKDNNKCTLKYVVNMDDSSQNICTSW